MLGLYRLAARKRLMQPKNSTKERFGWRRVPCAEAEVRLWLVNVGVDPAALLKTSLPLSQDEIARANRFHHPEDRARFMLTRAALRHLLAEATGREAHTLAFSAGPHGKPALVGDEELQFNASHSGALALVGISSRRPIGVDIELMRANIGELALAATFFGDDEHRFLESLEGPARLEAFHRIWTCKEAVLKAFGLGVTAYLKDFSVCLKPAGIDIEPAPGCFKPELATVRAAAVDVPPGYAAAYALA
jgi:4'-phosphopantetheinyl transferase